MLHIYAEQSGGMPENRAGERAEVILSFLEKEKNQKKTFCAKLCFAYFFVYLTDARFRATKSRYTLWV